MPAAGTRAVRQAAVAPPRVPPSTPSAMGLVLTGQADSPLLGKVPTYGRQRRESLAALMGHLALGDEASYPPATTFVTSASAAFAAHQRASLDPAPRTLVRYAGGVSSAGGGSDTAVRAVLAHDIFGATAPRDGRISPRNEAAACVGSAAPRARAHATQ